MLFVGAPMTNIRDGDTFVNSWWDWSVYNDCFEPTKIRISDIDGIVERRGHFLWIECKRPGEIITKGQEIMHSALTKNGSFTVLILWGEVDSPIKYKCISEKGNIKEESGIGTDYIKQLIKRWFLWANIE